MPITFRCPHCQQELSAPDEAAGQAGKCRFCGATVQAPTMPDESAQLIQPGSAPPPPPYGAEGYNAYATPPSPGEYSGYAGPTGEVNPAGIVGEAWQTLFGSAGLFIGAFVVLVLFSALQDVIGSMIERMGDATVGTLVNLLIGLVLAPMQFGLWHIAHNILRGRPAGIGDLFVPYQRFGEWLLFAIALGIANLPAIGLTVWALFLMFGNPLEWLNNPTGNGDNYGLGVLLFAAAVIYSFIVYTGFALAPVEMIDRGAGAIEAMKTSWATVSSHWPAMLGTVVLLTIVAFAGMLACCVGFLLTASVLPIGQVLLYRNLRGFQ